MGKKGKKKKVKGKGKREKKGTIPGDDSVALQKSSRDNFFALRASPTIVKLLPNNKHKKTQKILFIGGDW
jgi:hypothetical protein